MYPIIVSSLIAKILQCDLINFFPIITAGKMSFNRNGNIEKNHINNNCQILILKYENVFFAESEEGAYSLVFAENKTIHQFLYSRVVFQRRGLHTWTSNFKNDSNPSNVKKTSSSNFTIQPSDGFQGCMDYYNYDITLKHHGFTPTEKYISCIIFNGKPGLCNWKWIKTNGSFTVQLNRTEFNSTRVERYQKYNVGKNDMFGVVRCKLKDHEMMRSVIFDLPFVSVGEKMSAATESIISDSASINPVLLSITSALSALGLLILAFNYQRRKQRIAKMKDRIMR